MLLGKCVVIVDAKLNQLVVDVLVELRHGDFGVGINRFGINRSGVCEFVVEIQSHRLAELGCNSLVHIHSGFQIHRKSIDFGDFIS